MRIVLALALVPALAHADDDVPGFDSAIHWQLEPGMRFGSWSFDGQSGTQAGFTLAAGVRLHRLMLLAEVSDLGVSNGDGGTSAASGGGVSSADPLDGELLRIGAAARVYLARAPSLLETPLLADAWVELGLGRESITWSAGGVLGRGDLMVGIGTTFGLHGEHWKPNEHRWWGGMTFVVAAYYTPRTDAAQAATCGGPCDRPTAPSRLDRSIVFDLTIPFGQ